MRGGVGEGTPFHSARPPLPPNRNTNAWGAIAGNNICHCAAVWAMRHTLHRQSAEVPGTFQALPGAASVSRVCFFETTSQPL